MKPSKIISLGEVLWDLFPDGARFGGAPANFASHCALLGAEVTMVSAVGNDPRGKEAVAILKGFGINTDLIPTLPELPTGTVTIELDAKAKPTFTIHEGSAWDHIAWTPELKPLVKTADAVYFGTLGQRNAESKTTIHRALNAASEAGVARILDVNLRAPFHDESLIRESIAQASILKLSDDELDPVCSACDIAPNQAIATSLRQLLEMFQLDLVVMTRGAEGAILVSQDQVTEQPGIPTEVCDTVGAGDSFAAAFLIGLLRGDPHQAILARSCELASEVCATPGAVLNHFLRAQMNWP